jgi:parvulin-like peptidyl-prolyl isomerase
MTWKATFLLNRIFLLVITLLFLAACNGNGSINNPTITSTEESAISKVVPTATSEPSKPPTIDPDVPLAAIVNGQAITLAEYQTELKNARVASETGLIVYTEEDVLRNMIDEVLLAQGAAEANFTTNETIVQARLDQLNLDEQAIQDWMNKNGYTQESFEIAMERAIAATWMRDQIITTLPSTAEQVHARQILLYNADEAENIYTQLQSGTDFATLAAQYDPAAFGDLGWFPKGYLTVPELDEPVFKLKPGEYTQIIETILGFHIVQVVERDPQRPLNPNAFQTLQVQAVENWLIERRSQSDIQIILS